MTTSGGASSSSCDQGCNKLLGCGIIKIAARSTCISQCPTSATQSQIDCVAATTCDKIVAQCSLGELVESGGDGPPPSSSSGSSGSSFDVMECQYGCDAVQSCLTPAELSTCKARCSTASASTRETFTNCAIGSAGDCVVGKGCYNSFR